MGKKTALAITGIMLFAIATVFAIYTDGEKIASETNFYIVSNTEYWTGETGKVASRYVNFRGTPINANCNVSVIFPNETTYFIQDQPMNNSLVSGDFFHLFTVPAEEGVYDYSVTCRETSPPFRQRSGSKTFHVSPALNQLTKLDEMNQTIKNIYNDTQIIRNNFVTTTEFQSNMTLVLQQIDDVDTNLTTIINFCANSQTNSSDLCVLVHGINNQLQDINITALNQNLDFLKEINATTHSTFDFLTGSVFVTINNMFGVVNATNLIVTDIQSTVNNINTTTNTLLSNTSSILENQEEEVALVIVS